MTTYPSHFSQSLAGNHGAMAYLKASPTYHMNGLTALGMSHSLDSLSSQSLHYGGGKNSYLFFIEALFLTTSLEFQLRSSDEKEQHFHASNWMCSSPCSVKLDTRTCLCERKWR